jgi:hypothetical protein
MTTSPHVPDDDAPASREEDYDDAGRYVGDDPERTEDDRMAGDERIVALPEDSDDDLDEDDPPQSLSAP